MPEDNVVPILLLNRLVKDIQHDLERCKLGIEKVKAGQEEWNEAAFDLCIHLFEARKQYPGHSGDKEFGNWCASNGFGDDVINKQDRANAIKMGEEPEALRNCLKVNMRQSLQMIYTNEFRMFTSTSKHPPRKPKSETKKTPPKPRPSKVTPEIEAAVEERIDANEPIKREELAAKLNVSEDVIQRATTAVKAKRAVLDERGIEPLAREDMPPSMQQKFDAAAKKMEKELRIKIRAEELAAAEEVFNHYVVYWKKQVEHAERIVASFKGVMSYKVFRKIKACLHPDRPQGHDSAAEAFQLFSDLEDVLVKPEPTPVNAPPLPSSMAELMARRRNRTR